METSATVRYVGTNTTGDQNTAVRVVTLRVASDNRLYFQFAIAAVLIGTLFFVKLIGKRRRLQPMTEKTAY